MKSLRFLGFLFCCLIIALLSIGLYSYESPAALWAEMTDIGRFTEKNFEKISFYFSNAGSWNYLILLLTSAFLLVLFVCNDLWLERYFHSRSQKGFFKWGFAWLGQRSAAVFLLGLEVVLLANLFVWGFAANKMVQDLSTLPRSQTVLLLGTNKSLSDREGTNLYYTYRIEAVAKLYQQGKIKRIIISGDNGHKGYNEPADMRQSLIRKGVPASLIDLDYAGFRTLDSIVRLKGHFKVQKALIVSQRFHVERALLLAWLYEVEAIGYPAVGSMTPAMAARELFAKPKALLDVFVFNMQPRYGKTYAKDSIEWNNPKDRNFAVIVGLCCLFAGLMVFLFFRD